MILYLMAKTKFYQKKKTFQFEIRVLAKKIFIKKRTIITCLLLNLETTENIHV